MDKNLKANCKILFNQKGNTTFFGMLLLTFISCIFIHFIYSEQKNYLEIKDRSRVFLCQKKIIDSTEKFIKNVELLNLAIRSRTAIQIVALFFPGINLAALSSTQLKEIVQLKQRLELVAYMKNLEGLKLKKCSFEKNAYKTPYELNLLDFKRTSSGEAIIRERQWKQKTFGKNFFLTAEYNLKQKFPLKLERQVSESILLSPIKKVMPF